MIARWLSEEVNESQEPTKEFISVYEKEMAANIGRIREKVGELRKHPQKKEILAEIRDISQAMCDLAMVYGFEGVEVIAERIVRAVDGHKTGDDLERFLFRLNKAIDAIGDAMLLIDEKRERELIRKVSEKGSPKEIVDDSVAQPLSQEKQGDDFTFDIREDDRLISLLSDADGVAVEIDAEAYSGELEVELDLLKSAVEEGDISFDLPDEEANQPDSEDQDILEIDFKSPAPEKQEEKTNFWQKIGSLLGIRQKNRISFQE